MNGGFRFLCGPGSLILAALLAAACTDSVDGYALPQENSATDAASDALLNADAADSTVQDSSIDSSTDSAAEASIDSSQDSSVDSTILDSSAPEIAEDTSVDTLLDTGTEADAPSWIVGGVATCPEVIGLCNTSNDASLALQLCIDRVPDKMALELEPCRYSLSHQLVLAHPMILRTNGKVGALPCAVDGLHGCAELFALPGLDQGFGLIKATAAVTVDHLVLDGNRKNRISTHAGTMCASLSDNSYGFNGSFFCSSCTLQDSVSKNALCGTGFLVAPGADITIMRNTFAYNGTHLTQNLWSDGLTVHDADKSKFTSNVFIDNTDVDLIFGGCKQCIITGNSVKHTAETTGGSFAAIMIQKWPTTSGCYENVDISNNTVDCGPLRNCGSGLYIGSESWYPETPYGTLVDGTTSGLITKNAVSNAMNALYIAARGLAIYGNDFINAHGVSIPNSCHKSLVSETPIVVSPTTKSCHYNLENIDPVMSKHYSSANWSGCIPNYPF